MRPKVIFIRHAQWNYKEDEILPEEWERAISVAERLHEEFNFGIYSDVAPTKRARQTALALGAPAVTEFRELEEFPTEKESKWRKKVLAIQRQEKRDLVEIVFSFDELREMLRKRCLSLCIDLYSGTEKKDKLMVSHGATMTGLYLASEELLERFEGDKEIKCWTPDAYKGHRFESLDALVLEIGAGYLVAQSVRKRDGTRIDL